MKSLLYLNVGCYLLIEAAVSAAACSSCLVSSLSRAGSLSLIANGGKKHQYHHLPNRHHNHRLHSTGTLYHDAPHGNSFELRTVKSDVKAALIYIALRQLSTHFGHSVFTTSTRTSSAYSSGLHLHPVERIHRHRYDPFTLSKSTENTNRDDKDGQVYNDGEEQTGQKTEGSKVPSPNTDDNVVSASMVGAIGIYKNFISPLLPPACRFLPTCSQYGVQAIEKFGPTKGAVLTAWRLMRCTPFGGRGYDPPRWPPVSYTYGSY